MCGRLMPLRISLRAGGGYKSGQPLKVCKKCRELHRNGLLRRTDTLKNRNGYSDTKKEAMK